MMRIDNLDQERTLNDMWRAAAVNRWMEAARHALDLSELLSDDEDCRQALARAQVYATLAVASQIDRMGG